MDKETQSNISDLVTTALLFTAKAHMWHFNAKTHSKHVTYQELYEVVGEQIDTFAEASMGCGAILADGENLSVEFVPEAGAIEDTKSFVDYISEVRDSLEEEDFDALVSILDDLTTEVLKVIYKLERLA